MATTTPNIGLTLPVGTENVSRQVINGNWEIIDEEVGNRSQIKTQTHTVTIPAVSKDVPVGTIVLDYSYSIPAGRYVTGYKVVQANWAYNFLVLARVFNSGSDPLDKFRITAIKVGNTSDSSTAVPVTITYYYTEH